MKRFPYFLLNLSFQLNWTWLGEQIIVNRPFTVRVRCAEQIVVNPLFQMLGKEATPWSVHKDASTFPAPALYWDITLIISDNETDIKNTISVTTETVKFAYRSRYLAVYLGNPEDSIIKDIVNSAWAGGLRQFSVVRFADRSIFVAEPHCHLPRIAKFVILQWPDLTKLDLRNCTLTVGHMGKNGALHYDYSEERGTLGGYYAPIFRFAQSGLRILKVSFIQVEPLDFVRAATTGKFTVDILLMSLTHSVGILDLETVGDWINQDIWCVTNSCVLRDNTYLLWQEFSVPIWILTIVSVIGVAIALRLTASSPGVALGDSFFLVITTLAGVSAKFPGGHARWALSGWLWAVLVLITCYQSILHSMMAAPSIGLKIQDIDGLSKSDLDLLASYGLTQVIKDGEKSEALAVIAKRVQSEADVEKAYTIALKRNYARFIPLLMCNVLTEGMVPLLDYQGEEKRTGYMALPTGSWLYPALHRNFHIMEQSGMAEWWLERDRPLWTCSHETSDAKPIALTLLRPGFLLLGAGCFLALISFLVELLLARYKKLCAVEKLTQQASFIRNYGKIYISVTRLAQELRKR